MVTETKQIFLDACAKIAEPFKELGFRFLKSRQTMQLNENPWESKIYFWTSRTNCLSAISIRPYASLTNDALQKWRLEQDSPLRRDNYVAGGVMGNLFESGSPYASWLLSNDLTLNEKIHNQIILKTKETALPFFSLAKNPRDISRRGNEYLPCFHDAGELCEYLLFCGGTPLVQSYAAGVLMRKPILKEKLTPYLERFEADRSSYRVFENVLDKDGLLAKRLATFLVHYQIKIA